MTKGPPQVRNEVEAEMVMFLESSEDVSIIAISLCDENPIDAHGSISDDFMDDLDSIGSYGDDKDVCEVDLSLLEQARQLQAHGNCSYPPDLFDTDSIKLSMYQHLPRANTRNHYTADDMDDRSDEENYNHSFVIPLKPLEPEDNTVPKKICLPRSMLDRDAHAKACESSRNSRAFARSYCRPRPVV
jgi:hypothetical protein